MPHGGPGGPGHGPDGGRGFGGEPGGPGRGFGRSFGGPGGLRGRGRMGPPPPPPPYRGRWRRGGCMPGGCLGCTLPMILTLLGAIGIVTAVIGELL